jgi:transcriptional regulator with AAA-type ATPase domain
MPSVIPAATLKRIIVPRVITAAQHVFGDTTIAGKVQITQSNAPSRLTFPSLRERIMRCKPQDRSGAALT